MGIRAGGTQRKGLVEAQEQEKRRKAGGSQLGTKSKGWFETRQQKETRKGERSRWRQGK